MIESQYEIAYQQYHRDSLLFVRQVISPSEHESAKNELLQSRYSLEGSFATLENLNIQIAQLEESLLDLELQQVERETVIMQEYRTAMDQLHNSMNSWRLNYCLISPIEGVVTFTKYWNENQTITAGESVFSVVPDKEVEMIGVSMLPLARSGKVKSGQRVLIRFANYPDQEFGLVNGRVAGISLVPAEDNYRVEIELPDGLRTNYGKELPVSQEMQATAEIVTEDLRLIERFFQPLKKILKEGFQEP
ncbi:MAG: HlyD family secretion protein [Tannerellaceae bacterium]|nr:HlyD family secretion protein [Tannerellaceae bacterium]